METNGYRIYKDSYYVSEIIQKFGKTISVGSTSASMSRQESRVIEALLLRVPLPAVLLSEDKNGVRNAEKGAHVFRALQKFLREDKCLDSDDEDLKGKAFSELTPQLKNRINDTLIEIQCIPHFNNKEIQRAILFLVDDVA